MKLTFLGVSGALTGGFNSNILFDGSGTEEGVYPYVDRNFTMLFDCGEDIMMSLKADNRKPEELDAVFISHLHYDHCGGLSWLGYYTYFITQKKIKLFIHESMVSDLWAMLRPAMEKMHGKEMMSLTDYFDIKLIEDNVRFNVGSMQFYPVKQDHVITPHGNMYSYGLRGYGGGDYVGYQEADKEHYQSVWRFFVSSDTCKLNLPKTDNCGAFAKAEYHYDYIFCDCDVMNLNGVHPNYDDLKEMDEDIKSRMLLYHYSDIGDKMPDAEADGFAGFVKEGQIFEFSTMPKDIEKAEQGRKK